MSDAYDYIIVGAGSAGCVIANRLSADPATRVLLLEAGPSDNDLFVQMPRGFAKLLSGGERTWLYEAGKGGNRGKEWWMRGRTLGGSSSINGMVYVRGHPADYDGWEQLGCTGWGWSDVGRCFVSLEDHELGAARWRGAGGPLKISVIKPESSPIGEAIIRAAERIGVQRVADINDAPDGGIGYMTQTVFKGRRWSSSRAFLKPVRNRRTLTVLTGAFVRRILFEGRRAVGVEAEVNGALTRFMASREVILSGGALQSPVLLQHSGIGNPALLRSLGIEIVAEAPEVGENLLEHRNLSMKIRLTTGSLNHEYSGLRLVANALRYQFFGTGALTHSAHELCAFVKTSAGYERPDGQIGITLATVDDVDGKMVLEREHGMLVSNYYMQPKSRGRIAIASADPHAPPRIDVNYLAVEEDRRHSVALLRFIRRLIAQPDLKDYVVQELIPGAAFQTDEELVEALFEVGTSGYHVAGTCRMGSDPAAVLDPELRVRGVEGLRVVDTSIMPTLVSGNTNGPAMAIGQRAAELILGRHL